MTTSIIANGLINKFEDYLDLLIKELQAYKEEKQLWITTDGLSNSAGNLTTHLIGNLNHFIGAILGNSGYIRQRSLEFSIKNKSRSSMLNELAELQKMVPSILGSISDEAYAATYPFTFGKSDFKPTTFDWMVQIISHLAYHVGQINYHRRILVI